MFLPLKDLNPTRHFSYVTAGLIGLNVIVFVYELALGRNLNSFIAAYGMTPFEITRAADLTGSVGGTPIVHVPGPPLVQLTIITSMFIHGGFLHIVGNMLYLWIFGNNIEDLLGPVKFLVFYLVCGIAAAAAHVLTNPGSVVPTVGASGAVSGVLGAYLVVHPRARVLTLVFLGIFVRLMLVPAGVILVFWFVLQVFSGFGSLGTGARAAGVAWFAHIGGFVAGIALVKVMAGRRVRWMSRRR
jgi:membrane associated rhomboid family serine protease